MPYILVLGSIFPVPRVKDSQYLVEAFSVDRIYLKHQHQGRAPDYRVR
jgi:hypothetical protein